MKKKEYQKRLAKEKQDMKEYNDSNHGISVKSFIIIAVCVVGFVLLMFVFTKIKTGEWNPFTRENSITYSAEVQSTKILCGSILNREDSEYYVMAFEMNEDNASLYETIIEKYNKASNKLSLYKLDLGNSRNNICHADTANITSDLASLKLSVPTLIKVSGGKVIESYTDYNSIKNTLFSYVD